MIKLGDKDKAFGDQDKIIKQQKEMLAQEKALCNVPDTKRHQDPNLAHRLEVLHIILDTKENFACIYSMRL